MSNRPFDPLAHIPSSKRIRKKLSEVESTVKKLKVLLKTAQEIEAQEQGFGKNPQTSVGGGQND